MKAQPLLLAIKPNFADLILAGEKTYEYRKTVRRVKPGAIIVLYATSPHKAIVGHFTAGQVLVGSPHYLWGMTAHGGGIAKEDFDEYFCGAERGCAVEVKAPVRWCSSRSLSELRRMLPGFAPPRCVVSLGSSSPLVLQAVVETKNGHGSRQKRGIGA